MIKPLRYAGAAGAVRDAVRHQLCGGRADIKSGLKITFLPKQINNPYEVIADDGGLAAIKELKGVGKAVGPSDAGASSQVQYNQYVDYAAPGRDRDCGERCQCRGAVSEESDGARHQGGHLRFGYRA